jgi:hypothetical protein
MRGSQRQSNLALALVAASLLAVCPGCNPLGWGISHIDSMIHHHAQKPIVPEGELESGADSGVYTAHALKRDIVSVGRPS